MRQLLFSADEVSHVTSVSGRLGFWGPWDRWELGVRGQGALGSRALRMRGSRNKGSKRNGLAIWGMKEAKKVRGSKSNTLHH